MDELFAVVRDCLRADEPVAWATVIDLAPPVDGQNAALPPLGAKLVVRPDAEPMGSLGEPNLEDVFIHLTGRALR